MQAEWARYNDDNGEAISPNSWRLLTGTALVKHKANSPSLSFILESGKRRIFTRTPDICGSDRDYTAYWNSSEGYIVVRNVMKKLIEIAGASTHGMGETEMKVFVIEADDHSPINTLFTDKSTQIGKLRSAVKEQ